MATMKPERASSPWVSRYAHLAPEGLPVLDVACGSGRHSRFFLKRGYCVTGVDLDVSDFKLIDDTDQLTLIERDLEDGMVWQFGTQAYGTVVVTNYLHRPILAPLVAAVAPGGVLIYETFAQGNEAYGKPKHPDHLLRPGELIEMVRGKLQIVAYEHGYINRPRRAVVERICAVNGQLPAPLS